MTGLQLTAVGFRPVYATIFRDNKPDVTLSIIVASALANKRSVGHSYLCPPWSSSTKKKRFFVYLYRVYVFHNIVLYSIRTILHCMTIGIRRKIVSKTVRSNNKSIIESIIERHRAGLEIIYRK